MKFSKSIFTAKFLKTLFSLREKNITTYNSVWSAVRGILSNGTFPVKIADTMLGIKEAKYSWTTINHLLGEQVKQGVVYNLSNTVAR